MSYSFTLSHAVNLSSNDKCALAGEVDGRGTSVSVLINSDFLNAFVKLLYAFWPLKNTVFICGYCLKKRSKSFGKALRISESKLPSRAQVEITSHSATWCDSSKFSLSSYESNGWGAPNSAAMIRQNAFRG